MNVARIFYAEDDGSECALVERTLRCAGSVEYVIVLRANSLQEALRDIPLLNGAGVNIAILDGNLGSPDDGKQIAAAIRRQVPSVRIISHSGDPQTWGDVDVPKDKRDELVAAINALLSS